MSVAKMKKNKNRAPHREKMLARYSHADMVTASGESDVRGEYLIPWTRPVRVAYRVFLPRQLHALTTVANREAAISYTYEYVYS